MTKTLLAPAMSYDVALVGPCLRQEREGERERERRGEKERGEERERERERSEQVFPGKFVVTSLT